LIKSLKSLLLYYSSLCEVIAMISEKKKRKLRRTIESVRRQLGLEDYRLTARFNIASVDKDLKNNYAVVHVDDDRKTIYLKLNETICRSMSPGWLRRLALHELLHSFFWELDNLFEEVLAKGEFTEFRKEVYRNRFMEIEHKKIYRLVRVLAPSSHKMAQPPRTRKNHRSSRRKRAA
jgi:hypothetical protein